MRAHGALLKEFWWERLSLQLQRRLRAETQNKPRILVTAAAGRNASTAVLDLLGKGFLVRAFVRRQDARSEKLKQAGAEIFVGDLFDLGDLRSALVDVQRAYHSLFSVFPMAAFGHERRYTMPTG